MYFYQNGQNALQVITGILSGVPSLLIAVLSYVLTAMALYSMAKSRGIAKPWLAWIPVADSWILGSLSDQYRYVVRREFRSRRKLLLALDICHALLKLCLFCVAVWLLAGAITGFFGLSGRMLVQKLLTPGMTAVYLLIVLLGVKLVFRIVEYLVLYDIYHSCDPANAALYLVFTILFGITRPFFLYFNRNKELGMPPRKSAAE